MGLCYACRNTVADNATRCPYCTTQIDYGGGNPNSDNSFGFAAAVIIVGGVMLCSGVKWAIDTVAQWFS